MSAESTRPAEIAPPTPAVKRPTIPERTATPSEVVVNPSEVPRNMKLPEGVVLATVPDWPASKPETAISCVSTLMMLPVLVAESMVKAKVGVALKALSALVKVITPRRLLSKV